MKYKKMTALGVALSLLLVSCVAVAFATTPIEEDVPRYGENEVLVYEPEDGGSLPSNYGYGNEEELGYIFTELDDGGSLLSSYSYGNEEELGYIFTELDDDDSGIDPRMANISTDFTVKVGASFIRTFDMGVWFNDPHNALMVKISNTNDVPYKVIIINNEGYERITAEKTGPLSFTISNISTTAKYTFYIVNVGTKDLTGHVTINSYYF